MCEEWWMWHRQLEAAGGRRLWDEFERARPVNEPDRTDENEVTLQEPEPAPTAAGSSG